jgi:hypothetical protein
MPQYEGYKKYSQMREIDTPKTEQVKDLFERIL